MPASPKPQKLIPNKPLRDHISQMPCLVRGCPHKVAYHHLRSIGAGGRDEFNLIPLCYHEHHTSGIHTMPDNDFEKKHSLPDLKSLAIILTVGFFGAEKSVEKLAVMRGIDMESAEAIILDAIDNCNNDAKNLVG